MLLTTDCRTPIPDCSVSLPWRPFSRTRCQQSGCGSCGWCTASERGHCGVNNPPRRPARRQRRRRRPRRASCRSAQTAVPDYVPPAVWQSATEAATEAATGPGRWWTEGRPARRRTAADGDQRRRNDWTRHNSDRGVYCCVNNCRKLTSSTIKPSSLVD